MTVPKLFWVSSQISSDLLYRSYGECIREFFSTGFPSIASCDVVVLSGGFLWLFSIRGFVLPWVMAYRRSDCFVVLFWEMAGSRLFVFLCA